MPLTVTLDDLARATRRLRQHPADTGAWLEVAALLHALGQTDDAELAFATIGEGARIGGQVALAVACARHLAELGSVRGPELVDLIIETYAAGAQRSAAAPPRARSATEPPALAEELADPLAEARAVLERLGGWWTSRSSAPVAAAPLLSALPAAGARALIGVMTAHAFSAGARIIEIGEPASALYWIAHGTVAVTRDTGRDSGDAPGALLGELHSGAFFGENAPVGGTRPTARRAPPRAGHRVRRRVAARDPGARDRGRCGPASPARRCAGGPRPGAPARQPDADLRAVPRARRRRPRGAARPAHHRARSRRHPV